MTRAAHPFVFDGHNDALLRLWEGGPDALAGFAEGSDGHVDLPRAREGGFAGGFFAIFVPGGIELDMTLFESAEYDIPMPAPLSRDEGWRVTRAQADILLALEARGDLAICRSVSDIRAAMDSGQLAAILHVEGAEAIGPDLEELDTLHALGLRSIGPVWSRNTIFAHGVPFRFPSDGDIGPGLTEHGRRLVARAGVLSMVVDTSHLNVAGFWDVAEMDIPLVATHSNAHAICPSSRNLTDAQLRAIGETRGIVGLNFGTGFLRPDGQMKPDGAMEWVIRHLDHMIALAGEDHVALGSDFDGALVPREIGSVAGLGAVREVMDAAGYGDDLIAKICHRNWLDTLERIWGA